jgi:N-acetylmuramidase-like protein/putative peptidoglycan binding protein
MVDKFGWERSPMESIEKSVGRGGVNRPQDIVAVQRLLKTAIQGLQLSEDGKIGPSTIAAIDYFQAHLMRIRPDGRVDPKGATLIKLNECGDAPLCMVESVGLPAPGDTSPLKEADFQTCATKLGCEVAAIRAVSDVESKGSGFLSSKRPTILFEAHIFSRETFHCFDKVYPDISSKTWNKKLYAGGENEYPRLTKAMALDREAALRSASWGRFQLMGFNCKDCGYNSVDDFVAAMFASERKQLTAFADFVKARKLDMYLKSKNWADFAYSFNGPGYEDNNYDGRLEAAYKKYNPKK